MNAILAIAVGGAIVEHLKKGMLIEYISLVNHGGNAMGVILSPPSVRLGLSTMIVWNIRTASTEQVDIREITWVRST